MMTDIITIIVLPVAAGLLLFLIPEKLKIVKGIITLIITAIQTSLAISIFIGHKQTLSGLPFSLQSLNLPGTDITRDIEKYTVLSVDSLSNLIMVFIAIISLLIAVYSLVYLKKRNVRYFSEAFLITTGCSAGAVFSDNLLLFVIFWGILGMTLYKLIPSDSEESSAASKKTLILVGASDSIMLIGIAIIWKLTGTLNMSQTIITAENPLAVTAFLALAIGSFTKAGAFPFHTWVPDYTQEAPASSSALLPASLDKLLGIYLLARLTTGMFIIGQWMILLLLSLGVITIISSVMMALIQHDYKRLLGYHAVSQVGYMILGLALCSPLGIAAGLFHMLNHALYKSGLFLAAGAVEYRTGKINIDDLGGLSKYMPVTFISALIFAMAISGVPPLNGFASKWMIYQGIIDFGTGETLPSRLWMVWLGLAVMGSALTLASFIKFLGGIFLSRRRPEFETIREVPFMMKLPMVILSLFCVVFGVLATNVVVPFLFTPITGEFVFSGFWNSSLVSMLVLMSIVLGFAIYLMTGIKKFRSADSFIGGEAFREETSYPTPEFYKTISESGIFSWAYRKAGKKWFDLYDLLKQFVLWISHMLSTAHTGVLPGYIIWICAGLITILMILI